MNNKIHYSYSNIQLTFLVILRVLIGWYFLYEGLAKVFTPNWTAFGYLIAVYFDSSETAKLVREGNELFLIYDRTKAKMLINDKGFLYLQIR